MKLIRLLTLIVSFAFPCVLIGQSTSASLTGVVDDPSKAAIPGVSITAINTETACGPRQPPMAAVNMCYRG